MNKGNNMGENTRISLIILFLLVIIPIAQATIITGQGSSYTFNITDCYATPNTTLTCQPATIFFSCNIENPIFIDQVDYRIDGTDYTTTQNSTDPSRFYYFYNKPAETTTNLNPLTFDRQRITDVNNKKVNAYELVQIPRNCTTCPATYTQTTIQSCNSSDQKIIQYTSSNETCSPSYNATETCDYCQPTIISETTICDFNGTQTTSYTDLDYANCCLVTGLTNDCVINTALYDNETTQCNYLTKDFDCQIDTEPILNKKINLNCELPSENYTCIVNVYQELQNQTTTYKSTLLATTPEYKKSSGSLLSLAQESEERTSFQTDHRLLNAYYTTKELRPENTYKIQVLCSQPQQNSIMYEELVQPVYHTPDSIVYRSVWGTQNNLLIIFWGAVIILLTALIFWAVRTYAVNRSRRR